ncbi:MAG: hypothetical protein ACJ8HI_13675 [Massilia sp.]
MPTIVIQFTSTDPAGIALTKGTLLEYINTASRLRFWQGQEGYSTRPFDMNLWRQKANNPDTYWLAWSPGVYEQLGDDGRAMCDHDQAKNKVGLVGSVGAPGLLTVQPLPPHNIQMQLLSVDDLVASGYVPAPPL